MEFKQEKDLTLRGYIKRFNRKATSHETDKNQTSQVRSYSKEKGNPL